MWMCDAACSDTSGIVQNMAGRKVVRTKMAGRKVDPRSLACFSAAADLPNAMVEYRVLLSRVDIN